MYFPIGRESRLCTADRPGSSEKEHVYSVRGNRERSLLAVVTAKSLYIYLAHPQLLLCTYGRGPEDISEKGEFRQVYWRFDSSCICVLTSKNHILMYRVQISSESCYNLTDPTHEHYKRQSQELFLKESRPETTVSLSVVVNLAARATCAVALREELLVCLTNGFAHRISWTGQVDAEYSIRLSSIPFANDQLQSKPEFLPDGTFIRDIVYAPLIGGYCVVLSDGRAALLTSPDPRFHPTSLLAVWALQLRDAVCSDVNHKFRILIFGCGNGDVTGYHLDDANGALVQAFRVAVTVKDGPEIFNRIGAVSEISVLPNGSSFAVVWDNQNVNADKSQNNTVGEDLRSTLAIFSPFGSQIWCSLESCFSVPFISSYYTSLEWGPEGLQLWLGRSDGVWLLPIAWSASINNPVMEHSDRLVLISDSRILISPSREGEQSAFAPHSVWTTLQPHNDYLATNWPIRFASVERETARTLVVAGVRGLSHCTISSGRWKIFGNESQERDMMVTGGIFVWRGTVGTACHDSEKQKDLLRFYPLNTKLDNRFCSEYDTESRVLSLNLRDDILVTFDIDARILLYKLTASQSSSDRDSYVRVAVDRAAEIRVGDLITHPACLVSIHVTQLTQEGSRVQDRASFIGDIDTVLVNVSGRLITLNPKSAAKDEEDETRFQLNQPIMVASFVEQLWHDLAVSSKAAHGGKKGSRSEMPPHLTSAIWINCGARGMRVWLPLLPGRRGQATQESFISKRIMLPFTLDIHPVAICSADCLAIGIESTPTSYGGNAKNPLVLYTVHRNSEVFVHHILKQLLKRNLGVFALEIAATCRGLPYFPHALELLLHNVLEEEATSSEPIPDPLLPRIVAFVQEFPEFLRTVAHCARKTELALWPSLFAVTSSPNDLFEVCLRDGQLETAASYLIVLQSIENSQTSQDQAARLLREALSAGEWAIARDMVRFASAIDADDMDSHPRTPPPAPLRPSSRRPTKGASDGDEELVVARFQAAGKTGSRIGRSGDSQAISRKDSAGSGRRLSKAQSSDFAPPSPTTLTNPMADRLQSILREHALRLLEDYCIRDLGAFWSHLSIDLPSLLSSSNTINLKVNDWIIALTRLHSQFQWPYPIASRHVVDHFVRKFGSMRTSQSTASLSLSTVNEVSMSLPPVSESTVNESDKNGQLVAESVASEDTVTVVQEARLVPADDKNVILANGSSSGDVPRASSPGGSSINAPPGTPGIEGNGHANDMNGIDVLCGESAVRGPPECNAQLDHMMGLFKHCAAVEWIFLVCILRRDVHTLRKELGVSTVRTLSSDTLCSLKNGCNQLIEWAQKTCIGYLSVLHLFDAHIQLMADANGVTLTSPVEKKKEEKLKDVRTVDQNGTSHSINKTSDVPQRSSLRDSFGPRRRERSRSADRHNAVSTVDPESSDCIIM